MITRVQTLEFDFSDTPPEQIDAGMGRRIWLQHMIQPDESVIDLGGTGGMLHGWHKKFSCRDDLSGYGPPGQLHGDVTKGDIQETPYLDDEFDVAVMTEVLEHVPDPVRAMREAGRIAKRVVITVPNELQWKNGLSFKLGGHFRYYTAEIFAAQLRKAELTGEIGQLNFGTWSFWLAVVGREQPSVSVLPVASDNGQNDSPLAKARRLAAADDPLAARDLLLGRPISDEEVALLAQIDGRLAHTQDRDAYREFYATPAPERPFFDEAQLANAHRICPRVGIIRQELDRQGARSVLELGCLDGWVSLNLATAGYSAVGVDLAPHAIAEAKARAARHALPCSFHEGFIEDLDFKDKFDAVLLLEVLEHVMDVGAVLAAAERHLAPGGRVYISAPLTPPPHKHERERREHVRLVTENELKSIMKGAGRVQRWYQQMSVPDGMHHFGAYTLDKHGRMDGKTLIVIPSVGQNMHFAEETIRAIRQLPTIPHDILVLLDEPAPTQVDRFVALGVELSVSPVRRGLVPAVNVAFHRFMRSDAYGSMMLIDDSIGLVPGWDTALMRTLTAHPEFGWVSCQQTENMVTPFTSFCSLMSRAAVETLRGFDLIFSPMHYDDADAIMRLRKAGFEPHGIPFKVHHLHDQAATQQWRHAEHQLCGALSQQAFKWRWKMDDFDWKTVPVHQPCEVCSK